MNAKSETIELDVLGGQIPEAVCSVFHTLLLSRSTGKYNYHAEASYKMQNLPWVDVTCDFVNMTYVRIANDDLDRYVKSEVDKFSNALRLHESSSSSPTGEIVLTFYQKRRRMVFCDIMPWEIWSLKLKVIHLPNEHERNAYRSQLGWIMGEKIIGIHEILSRDTFVPHCPNASEHDNIFNSSYPNFQPYHFKIEHSLQPSPPPNMQGQMRQFLRDALNI